MAPDNDQADAPTSATGPAIDWPSVLARHGSWLRAVILARVGEAQAVEEVFQEVSLAAIRQQAPLKDESKVAPWLYQLAVRQSLLYRRKRGRQRKLIERYANRLRPGDDDRREPNPLDWLLADERRQQVRVALRRLPPRDAEMLLLKYTQNWSYRQIADHLGTTTSAVESRLHRARGRLRRELEALQTSERAATTAC